MASSYRIWIKRAGTVVALILCLWLLRSLFWKLFSVPTVNSIAFSPNGQLLAGAGGWLTPHDGDDLGGALWVWDARSGAVKQRLTARFSSMQVLKLVAFSKDGATLAAWQDDGRKFLWDVESGRLLTVEEPADVSLQIPKGISWRQREAESFTEVLPFATSPSGNRLLDKSDVAQRQVVMSRIRQTLANHPQERLRAVSGQSTTLVTYESSPRATLRIRDAVTDCALQVLPEEFSESYPLKFSPDAKLLALQHHGGLTPSPLHLWDLRQRRLRLTLKSQVVAPQSLAFSPDGTTLAESGGYGEVEVWDVTRGRRLRHWVAG